MVKTERANDDNIYGSQIGQRYVHTPHRYEVAPMVRLTYYPSRCTARWLPSVFAAARSMNLQICYICDRSA